MNITYVVLRHPIYMGHIHLLNAENFNFEKNIILFSLQCSVVMATFCNIKVKEFGIFFH